MRARAYHQYRTPRISPSSRHRLVQKALHSFVQRSNPVASGDVHGPARLRAVIIRARASRCDLFIIDKISCPRTPYSDGTSVDAMSFRWDERSNRCRCEPQLYPCHSWQAAVVVPLHACFDVASGGLFLFRSRRSSTHGAPRCFPLECTAATTYYLLRPRTSRDRGEISPRRNTCRYIVVSQMKWRRT